MVPYATYFIERDGITDQTPRSQRYKSVREDIPGEIDVIIGIEKRMPYVSEIVITDPTALARLKEIARLTRSDLVKFESGPSGNVKCNGQAVPKLSFPLLNMRQK